MVAWRNAAPVKLGEIARIVDGVENTRNGAWDHNDQPYVGIAISRQPDANLVEIAAAVRAMLPSLRAQVPPSIDIKLRTDHSIPIREAVWDVQETLLFAVGSSFS